MSRATQRTTPEVVDWYRKHEVWPGELPFDPDGMCLAICRTARNILPGAPSAIAAALATPEKYRVYDVKDLRKGMVLYYDDPNDSNPYGHIVTDMGRVGLDQPDDLGSIITRTNSVVPNKIVTTRGDYFRFAWGDAFMFGAMWLNGEPFYDLVGEKPKPKPKQPRIEKAIDNYGETIRLLRAEKKRQAKTGHERYARALDRDLDRTVDLRDALVAQYRKQRGLE